MCKAFSGILSFIGLMAIFLVLLLFAGVRLDLSGLIVMPSASADAGPAPTTVPGAGTCEDRQDGGVVRGSPVRLIDWARGTRQAWGIEFTLQPGNASLGNAIWYAAQEFNTEMGFYPAANVIVSIHVPESQFARFIALGANAANVEGFGWTLEYPAVSSEWDTLNTVDLTLTGAIDQGMAVVFWYATAPNILPPYGEWIAARAAACNWAVTPVGISGGAIVPTSTPIPPTPVVITMIPATAIPATNVPKIVPMRTATATFSAPPAPMGGTPAGAAGAGMGCPDGMAMCA
jgi:hypothetical protein